eukprot:207138_1
MVWQMITHHVNAFVGAVRARFSNDNSLIKSNLLRWFPELNVNPWTHEEMLTMIRDGTDNAFSDFLRRLAANTALFKLVLHSIRGHLIKPLCKVLSEDPGMFERMVGQMIQIHGV